ncbi:MAG: tetratricopeptide repeat protein [Syntrophobacteraceae bacterium]
MGAPVIVFFDTSFISEAPLESVKFFLDQSDAAFITDRVLEELQAGYDSNPKDERFSSIFKVISHYRMTNNLRVISLEKCTKDNSQPDFTSDTVFLKRNSLLCSGYYAWLHCSMNPSMLTDLYRHMYNAGLYAIRTKGDPENKMTDLLGHLRSHEIDQLERIGFRKDRFTASALRKARKKRLKDTKKNTTKITDYSLVVTAFLYFSFWRRNVILLTCDNDLHDIKDNLIRSAIEKYTLNKMLTDKMATATKRETLNNDSIRLSLRREEILDELINNTFKRLNDTAAPKGIFQVAFYDIRDNKIYGGVERLPVWLLDFVLEYRLNLNCYSADEKLEAKYPFNYIMNPSEDFKEIDFNITVRKKRNFYGLMSDCEDVCNYSRRERDTPSDITSFVEKSAFDNKSEPDFSNPWLNTGQKLLESGRYEKALSAIDKAIDLQNGRIEAWYGKGIALGNLGRYEEALEACYKVIELSPDHAEAWHGSGAMLSKLNRHEEAILSLDKVIALKPDGSEAHYHRGISLCQLHSEKKALEAFDKAIHLNPDYVEALYARGALLCRLTRYEEAVKDFNTVIQLKPNHVEALLANGFALDWLNRNEEALQAFDRLIQLKPESTEAWGGRAVALSKLDRNKEALEALDKVITFNPNHAAAWLDKGRLLQNLDRDDEALEALNGAIALDCDNFEAWFLKGFTLFRLDRHEEAVEALDKAIEFNPGDAEAWYYKGCSLDGLGLNSEAFQAFDKAVERNPDYAHAWGGKSISLIKLDRDEEAIQSCDKAIALEPGAGELWNDMAIVLSKCRGNHEALKAFDKAIELSPTLAYVWYNRACAHAQCGNKEKSLSDLSVAIGMESEYKKSAEGDESFESLRDTEDFKRLVIY